MYFLTPLRSQSPFPTQHLNQCAVLWAFKGNQMAVASQFGCHFVFPGALGWVFRCGQSIGAAPLLVGEGPTEREAPPPRISGGRGRAPSRGPDGICPDAHGQRRGGARAAGPGAQTEDQLSRLCPERDPLSSQLMPFLLACNGRHRASHRNVFCDPTESQ